MDGAVLANPLGTWLPMTTKGAAEMPEGTKTGIGEKSRGLRQQRTYSSRELSPREVRGSGARAERGVVSVDKALGGCTGRSR